MKRLRVRHACSVTVVALFRAFVRCTRECADTLTTLETEAIRILGHQSYRSADHPDACTEAIRGIVDAANRYNGKKIGFETWGHPGWSIIWNCEDGTIVRLTFTTIRHELIIEGHDAQDVLAHATSADIPQWDAGIVIDVVHCFMSGVPMSLNEAAVAALGRLL